MSTKKSVYTDAVIATMKAVYLEQRENEADNSTAVDAVIAEVAQEHEGLKLTPAAVRSKLATLKVYQKDEARKVGGASGTRKVQIVKAIAAAIGVDFDEIESLEKATKPALEAIVEAVSETEAEA